MLLLNWQLYREILVQLWVLPLGGAILIGFMLRKALETTDRQLAKVEKTQKVDLFPVVPNYSRMFFRFGLITNLFGILLLTTVFSIEVPKEYTKAKEELPARFKKIGEQPRTQLQEINPQQKKIELKREFSGGAFAMAFLGLKVFVIEGLDEKWHVTVPGNWDEIQALQVLQNSPVILAERAGRELFVEETLGWVNEYMKSKSAFIFGFLISCITMTLPINILLFVVICFIGACLGVALERRLIKKILGNLGQKVPVKVKRPIFVWGYSMFGKNRKTWCYLLVDSKGKKRFAIIPKSALSETREGYLLDTWPGSAKYIVPLILFLLKIAGLRIFADFGFLLFGIPLIAKNVFFPNKKTEIKGY